MWRLNLGRFLNGLKCSVGFFRMYQPNWNAESSKVLFTDREFAGMWCGTSWVGGMEEAKTEFHGVPFQFENTKQLLHALLCSQHWVHKAPTQQGCRFGSGTCCCTIASNVQITANSVTELEAAELMDGMLSCALLFDQILYFIFTALCCASNSISIKLIWLWVAFTHTCAVWPIPPWVGLWLILSNIS